MPEKLLNAFRSEDKAKLEGIQTGAEVNPSASEIKVSYESNADTNAFTDTEKINLGNQTGINTGDQDISGIAINAGDIESNVQGILALYDTKAEKTNVLRLNNTTAFTPDSDYEPATKKYVDDNGTFASGYSTTEVVTAAADLNTFYKINIDYTVTGIPKDFTWNGTLYRWEYTGSGEDASVFLTFSGGHGDTQQRILTYEIRSNGLAIPSAPKLVDVESQGEKASITMIVPSVSLSNGDYIELYGNIDSDNEDLKTSNANFLIR